MNKIVKLLTSVCLLPIAFAVHAAENDMAMVKQNITAFMQQNAIPGVAVEIFVDGKPYAYYAGYANRDKKTPVDENTIFEIGSLTKLMTSLLLAQEVDQAKIDIHATMTKYLSFLPESYSDITLQNLATHTSGLPFDPSKQLKNQAELEKYLTTWEPNDAPNEQWTYSNFGMGMLGYALEAATHKNLNQLYRNNILLPLGMQPIALTIPHRLKANFAQGYDSLGNIALPSQYDIVFPAAGLIKASANDMRHFLSAAIGLPGTPQQIFYPMRMTQAAFVQLPNKWQGLGWQIHPVNAQTIPQLLHEPEPSLESLPVVDIVDKPKFDGDALIDKTGTTKGFRAYIALIPNKKSGIVILANKNVSTHALVGTARKILFKLTNLD